MPKAKTIPSKPASIIDEPSLISSRVISVAEAKRLLQCGTTHVYDLMNAKKIRSYKDGANRRIFLVSVLQYQEQREKRAAA
jgi:excisionase family DNA binding protein